jgi:hypothetical protein
MVLKYLINYFLIYCKKIDTTLKKNLNEEDILIIFCGS